MREILTGPKGGHYWIDEKGKKHYISTKTTELSNVSKRTKVSTDTIRKIQVKSCCCCGKPLNESDCRYYDLSDYCPRCALADGIITSLE